VTPENLFIRYSPAFFQKTDLMSELTKEQQPKSAGMQEFNAYHDGDAHWKQSSGRFRKSMLSLILGFGFLISWFWLDAANGAVWRQQILVCSLIITFLLVFRAMDAIQED
jgi:hypothetical protein